MTTPTDTVTLAQILSDLGWTHQPHTASNRQGRDIYLPDGSYLGVFTAEGCWNKLRLMGLLPNQKNPTQGKNERNTPA